MINDNEQNKAGYNNPAFSCLPTFDIERDYLKQGYKVIAGFDEVGRGSLSGPLTVGMTIYSIDEINSDDYIKDFPVNDSKKISEKKREELLAIFKDRSVCSLTAHISHNLVDTLNVNGATAEAILRLIKKSPAKPDLLLMDGNFSFDLGIPIVSIKKGDTLSVSIASASIIAKVERDNIMKKMNLVYPGYSFEKNKGYGTKLHRDAIHTIGYCNIHRKSYEPVKSLLKKSN